MPGTLIISRLETEVNGLGWARRWSEIGVGKAEGPVLKGPKALF